MKTFKAYLIDSKAKTVTEVPLPEVAALKEMQKLVGGYIETAVHFPDADVVFVDEEGLMKAQENFFIIEGAHQPFAGNGLMVGMDDEGETGDVRMPLEDFKKLVTFADLETVRKWEG